MADYHGYDCFYSIMLTIISIMMKKYGWPTITALTAFSIVNRKCFASRVLPRVSLIR